MGWQGLDGPLRVCNPAFRQVDADQPSDPHKHQRQSCRLGDTCNLVNGSGRNPDAKLAAKASGSAL
jgi:hypothetical protein